MSDVYLDMDGVLCNWTKAVAVANNAIYPQGRILKPYELDNQLKRYQIDAAMMNPDFWLNLEKFSWADDLVKLVNDTCPTWRFLTRGNTGANSYGGKSEWIDRYYKQHRERLVVCRGSKNFACKPGDILIDDHPANIQSWNLAGGHGYIWWERADDFIDGIHEELQNVERFLQTYYK